MFRQIVCAYDDSPTSQEALRHSFDLAAAFHAQLTVVSVASNVPRFAFAAGINPEELQQAAVREAEAHVRRAAEAAPESLGLKTVIRTGHPGEQLVELVEESGADLVVMGSRGRGRLASGLLGSTSGEVHFHSRCSLLVVHADDVEVEA